MLPPQTRVNLEQWQWRGNLHSPKAPALLLGWGLTPQQKCSWCILLSQLTGLNHIEKVHIVINGNFDWWSMFLKRNKICQRMNKTSMLHHNTSAYMSFFIHEFFLQSMRQTCSTAIFLKIYRHFVPQTEISPKSSQTIEETKENTLRLAYYPLKPGSWICGPWGPSMWPFTQLSKFSLCLLMMTEKVSLQL